MIDRERIVDDLFAQAVELEEDDRQAFLAEASAKHKTLASAGVINEVVALLRDYQSAEQDGFLQQPLLSAETTQTLAEGQEFEGYRILRLIGEGGMGEVYLAQDVELNRKVAIKLIKSQLKTKELLRRFRNERQILANLQHPNIAKLFQAGASRDGLPFFVMEYVEGKPIDQYADDEKLSVAERLKLFRAVCAAVHYAHQNLVIHRDLKPSNILVTQGGAAKLLDFGIAKLLNQELAQETLDATASALRLMTPEYASPEQVKGETLTTASDVYSLGVLLYELLTGHRPYRLKSRAPHEVIKAVLEDEPEKPSTAVTQVKETPTTAGEALRLTPQSVSETREGAPERLRRRLQGDIDNIVLMALRKEPQRRYASVEQFSEDIRRHLEGLPVSARKDTLGYRTAKFIQRNKVGVTAAALAVVAVVGGMVTTLWEARVAKAQRARAERRFNDVRKLAHSVLFNYHDAIADLPGSTPVRERLVKDALQYLDSLAGEASSDASLQSELAAAYRKVGNVQGNPYFANLGDTPGAVASYRKSLAIRQTLAAAHPQNSAMRRDVADSLEGLGDVLWEINDLKGADQSYRQAAEILETLSASAPGDLELRRELARAYAQVGDIKGHPYFPNLGDTAGGLESHRRALALRESLVAAEPNNADYRRALYQSCYSMGYMLRGTGDLAGAAQSLRRAVEITQSLAAADPNNARAKRNATVPLTLLGDVLRDQGKSAEALDCYRQAQSVDEAILAADPTNAQARRDLGVKYSRIAGLLVKTGDFAQAIEMSRKALAIDEAAYAANPNNRTAQNDLTTSYDAHGDILLRSGDAAAALQNYRKALTMREEYARQNPKDLTVLPGLEDSYERLGDTAARAGNALAAIASYRKAQACGEQFLNSDPKRDRNRDSLATVCYKLGKQTALVAASAHTPPGSRPDYWSEARTAYQCSLKLFTELRQKGALRAEDESKPNELAKEIAQCDAALAKLQHSQTSSRSSATTRHG